MYQKSIIIIGKIHHEAPTLPSQSSHVLNDTGLRLQKKPNSIFSVLT